MYYLSQNTGTHDAEIDLFNGRKRAGILYFYREGRNIPADSTTVNGAYGHFRLQQFEDVLKLLQSEDPIYVRFDSTKSLTYIQTGWEPVGEEEGDS